jgi:hypothetical protein
MSTIIVRHRVADFDAWRAAYEDHGSTRKQYGITDRSLHRDDDDPNMVTAVLAAGDLDRARDFVASADLKEAMERAGVISQPEIWFTNDV